MKTLAKEQRTVYVGLSAEARKLGISHTHLKHLLDGNRSAGAGLQAKMRKRGYKFDMDGYVVTNK